jgi:hypothetical protein
MKIFISALGLLLIIEGLPYFAFPEKIKKWVIKILELETPQLRLFGFLCMVAGLILVYLSQRY